MFEEFWILGDLSRMLWKYWIKWTVHIGLAILDVAKNTVKYGVCVGEFFAVRLLYKYL